MRNEGRNNKANFIDEGANILNVVKKVEEQMLDRIDTTIQSPSDDESNNEIVEELPNAVGGDYMGWTNQIPTPRPELNGSQFFTNEDEKEELKEKSNFNELTDSYQKSSRDIVPNTLQTDTHRDIVDKDRNFFDNVPSNAYQLPPKPNWSPETSWKNQRSDEEKSKEDRLNALKAFVKGETANLGYKYPTDENKKNKWRNDLEYRTSSMDNFQLNARQEIRDAQENNENRRRDSFNHISNDYYDNGRDPDNINYSDFYGNPEQEYESDYEYVEKYNTFREPHQLRRPNENFRAYSESIETFVDEPIKPFTDSSIQSIINSITQEVDWSRPLKLFPKLNN